MKIKKNNYRKYALYIGLAVVFLTCWWIGWRDYDPFVAQEVVRENIRGGIQGIIQISIQYVLPISILVFFTSELFDVIPLGQDHNDPS